MGLNIGTINLAANMNTRGIKNSSWQQRVHSDGYDKLLASAELLADIYGFEEDLNGFCWRLRILLDGPGPPGSTILRDTGHGHNNAVIFTK